MRLTQLMKSVPEWLLNTGKRWLVTAAEGANRLNVADQNSNVKMLTNMGRNTGSSPFNAQATI